MNPGLFASQSVSQSSHTSFSLPACGCLAYSASVVVRGVMSSPGNMKENNSKIYCSLKYSRRYLERLFRTSTIFPLYYNQFICYKHPVSIAEADCREGVYLVGKVKHSHVFIITQASPLYLLANSIPFLACTIRSGTRASRPGQREGGQREDIGEGGYR